MSDRYTPSGPEASAALKILHANVCVDTLNEMDERNDETGEALDVIAEDLGLDETAIEAMRYLWPSHCDFQASEDFIALVNRLPSPCVPR